MQQPLQITIKDIENTPAIEEQIRTKADKLEQYFDEIISCHVLVEQTQKHQTQGKLFSIHIKLCVPGKELVVTRNAEENLWMALREAFNSMREQLTSYRDQMRNHVKSHPELIQGEVVRIIDDFGFIVGPDGITEYYFNAANVVSPKFDKLKVGTRVHFIEAMGNEGPQAHRVSGKEQQSTG